MLGQSDDARQTTVTHETLTLNITEQCNLECRYCYQAERRTNKKKHLDLNVAKKAIAKRLSTDDQYERVIIELIGGEPFLYPKLIRDIIDWTCEHRHLWRKQFGFTIDTNGTVLTDSMKSYLRERRDIVVCSLSLDGTPEAHNLNRSNSYDKIAPHLAFFAETWPHQPVKMTIGPDTLSSVYDGIVHIMQNGFLVAANLAMEDIWGDGEEKARNVAIFRDQIERLVALFLKHPDLPLPSLIDLPIGTIGTVDHDRPWCGTGRSMSAVDVDGAPLPCNRFAAMSFDQSILDRPIAPDLSRCNYCLFKPACQNCEALNWEVNGNPRSHTTFHCEFSKLQIWASARIHGDRLSRRAREILEMSPEGQAELADELALITRHLMSIANVLEAFDNSDDPIEVGMAEGWRDRLQDRADQAAAHA